MTTISHSAHHPEVGGTYFSRSLSVAPNGGGLWIAAQMDEARANKLVVIRTHGQVRSSCILDSGGYCHQPCVVPEGDDGVAVVWNEAGECGWKIKSAHLDGNSTAFQDVQTVFYGERLCLPPSAVTHGDTLWVAWAGISGDRIRIHAARRERGQVGIPDLVSSNQLDAFRPSLAANGNGVFLAWDQYNGRRYEVVLARFDGAQWRTLATLSEEGERWLRPKVVAVEDAVYLTWLVLREVTDDLGIIDHLPFAMVARFEHGRPKYLVDESHPLDNRIVADLREGLLASVNYMGYAGLRRNPTLTLTEDGDVWCVWEVKLESEKTKQSGHLAGRKLRSDDTWTNPSILHSHRVDYAVSAYPSQDGLPIAFIRYHEHGLDVIGGDFVRPEKGKPYTVDGLKWQRWRDARIEIEPKPTQRVRVGEHEYALFWADTHCHSEFSPDAEGKVDELIHYGRDIAGLDAICVVDNDCYPHKALSEAEWRIHQAFSTYFTDEGRFVVFPGWEYTYHRKDNDPNFNHRWFMYPRAGGKLYRRIDPDAQEDERLFQALADQEVVCVPHHPVFKIVDPDLDRNVEVCSSWRVCIEEVDFIVRLLQDGEVLGFVACSDSHRAVPGLGGALTGLFAEDLTPEALYDAYRQRRTIATQGFPIFCDFWAGGTFIGGRSDISGVPEIEATVRARREIALVQVLRDGWPIYAETPHDTGCAFRLVDEGVGPGTHFYYLRVKLVGDSSFNYDPQENVLHRPFTQEGRYPGNLARARGVFAWTSPVWLNVGPV